MDQKEIGDWRRIYDHVETVELPSSVTKLFGDDGDHHARNEPRSLSDLIGTRIETHSLNATDMNGKAGFVEGRFRILVMCCWNYKVTKRCEPHPPPRLPPRLLP